jgi:hypothetical protein
MTICASATPARPPIPTGTDARGSVIDCSRSCRHDGEFLLVEGCQSLRIQLQMCLHQLGGRQRQPLVERDVGIVVALEDFEEAQHRGAGVFDVMSHRERHVADIAGHTIKGTRLA